MKDIQLTTPRLILRKPQKSDWKDIVEGAGEYDLTKTYNILPHPYKKSDAEAFITNSIKNFGNDRYTFVVELKVEKKVIGVLGLRNINPVNNTANTDSWINKKYWRQGYITEAKIALNNFAFSKLKLRRLDSSVYTTNKASNATQRKMGYRLEGTKRKAQRNVSTGKIHDTNIYGLLKEDWKKARIKLLKK